MANIKLQRQKQPIYVLKILGWCQKSLLELCTADLTLASQRLLLDFI